ncbi:unnamed protein product [Ectocarpus sp. 8 AP-2014]
MQFNGHRCQQPCCVVTAATYPKQRVAVIHCCMPRFNCHVPWNLQRVRRVHTRSAVMHCMGEKKLW